jgi:hypothetical protein
VIRGLTECLIYYLSISHRIAFDQGIHFAANEVCHGPIASEFMGLGLRGDIISTGSISLVELAMIQAPHSVWLMSDPLYIL